MSLKKIAVCGTILAAAVVATALAAKADTVVWYTFDDLGDVGTKLADSSTIQNKANPGTLDATVYGLVGTSKDSSSSRMPYVTNGVPESVRVLDPVGNTIASAADKALRFWRTHGAGNGAMLEIPNDPALRPSSFTVEMFVRVDPEHTNWEMIASQPHSTTTNLFAWGISFYKPADNSYLNFTLNFVDTSGVKYNHGVPGSALLDNKWHHIALTVKPQPGDQSKINIKFYIDYVRVYYFDAPYGIVLPDSAGCPVQIGGTTMAGQHFAGEIGEFRFSDKALDIGEFLRPHNKAIDKDVVLYYDFEDTDAYDGNFAYSTNSASDVVNKASPIMPGAFKTAVGTDSKTYPFIDEASPAYRVLPAAGVESDKSMNSTHAFRNAAYTIVGSSSSSLKCTPAYEDLFRDAEDFTCEMFYKCGEKEYSEGTIAQQTKLFAVPGQFVIGFGNNTAQMMPVLVTSSGNVNYSNVPRVDDGKWHHIAIVVSQSGDQKTFSFYHDYELNRNASLNFSGTVVSIASGTAWIIGAQSNGRSFDGWIDSLRVTTRALDPSEFLQKERAPGLTLVVW